MNDGKNIFVTDQDWAFLENTRPGKARKLVKEGDAKFISKDPPFIQLQKKVCVKKEDFKMNNLRSIDQYFRENDEVYIRNASGGVVSLTFYDQTGRVEPFTIPNEKRPIRLTDYIPKDLILKSPDFRKLIMRRPPAIILLNSEDYFNTLNKVAVESGKKPEQVVDEIQEKLFQARARLPISELVPDDQKIVMKDPEESSAVVPEIIMRDAEELPVVPPEGGKDSDLTIPGSVNDGVHPRVLQIIGSCSKLATNRMKANDAISELDTINLTLEDLNYISSNCAYKTVQHWATKKLSDMEKAGES